MEVLNENLMFLANRHWQVLLQEKNKIDHYESYKKLQISMKLFVFNIISLIKLVFNKALFFHLRFLFNRSLKH
jgi:hypothetical protein